MRIDMPPRRPRGESIIPMINVVFLLLIFFLLTARITPPVPFEVTPPKGAAEETALQQGVLHVSAAGDLAYDAARGEAVWALIAARDAALPLEIRADAATPAAQVAALLRRLGTISEAGAQLVVSGG
ncbi:biopolymer transporter ExbD [Paracoccus spongiarum]|uniref:Biopolymer transporter ExbD n=1 Tax=Paracoccus spongiarum TaxID=3064387 RepID=A0ABT9JFV0_9RHOB|nr:biopolymer transporter ExbD [Paracoccus sp. 2205BS29-5]MDP5307936.1 biopolymer transporter ExbD [Paracoccus sp. 2205BS29-5]